MAPDVALIGFGEAGQTFAAAGRWGTRAFAFDIKTDAAASRAAKLAEYAANGITGCEDPASALVHAELILSLVTADQALAAAERASPILRPGALYCDMNSVAPATKKAAATRVEAAGGRYVDVAILAPVNPAGLKVPLLISGPAAAAAEEGLRKLGFRNIRNVGPDIGRASAIKMVRSVMVKGLEALTAEWILAAEAAGVREEVLASLDESWPRTDWAARVDYNLDRMMIHGLRRAAEMEEVLKMLHSLQMGGDMTAATIRIQRSIGERSLTPGTGLADKLRQLLEREGSKP